MGKPITDTESTSEHPQSFDPRLPSDDSGQTEATALIKFDDDGKVMEVEGFVLIEAVGLGVRVWYEEPSPDATNYVTYSQSTIVEVKP